MSRIAAIAALALLAAAAALAVVGAVQSFPHGLTVLACLVLGVVAAWFGLLRTGIARTGALVVAALLLAVAVVLVVVEGDLVLDVLVLGVFLVSLGLARSVFSMPVQLSPARQPERPVLIYNPKSGGGKAERFHLAREARRRGIEPIELQRGDDLRAVVDDALTAGADALAVAGGDGTQAIVAAIAADQGLPYACLPAGTRNPIALATGDRSTDGLSDLDRLM